MPNKGQLLLHWFFLRLPSTVLESGMGLTEVFLPTGYSTSPDDVTRKTGDLARVEATSSGMAVYWHEVLYYCYILEYEWKL